MTVPEVAEQSMRQVEQMLGRAKLAQQRLELALDYLALDRLALVGAALRLAEIISVAG